MKCLQKLPFDMQCYIVCKLLKHKNLSDIFEQLLNSVKYLNYAAIEAVKFWLSSHLAFNIIRLPLYQLTFIK